MIEFKYNDGGRSEAGFKGKTGDCVARSIAIATGKPYEEIYKTLAEGNQSQRKTKKSSRVTGKKTASHGINVKRKWFKEYMENLGFVWVSVMGIGTGCTTHLRADELPKGKLVLSLSGHYATVVDGVLNDTYDCSREGTRCVYGYWKYNG